MCVCVQLCIQMCVYLCVCICRGVLVHTALCINPTNTPPLQGVSECYECYPKPQPKTFPVCTIRNTPSAPIHCIVWAKHLFKCVRVCFVHMLQCVLCVFVCVCVCVCVCVMCLLFVCVCMCMCLCVVRVNKLFSFLYYAYHILSLPFSLSLTPPHPLCLQPVVWRGGRRQRRGPG
jgi:hypothetical protein